MAVDQIAVFGYRQRAPIQLECVDDLLLRVLDDRVQLIGWHVDERGREIGEEPLEPSQPLVGRPFQCPLETPPLCEIHHPRHETLLFVPK